MRLSETREKLIEGTIRVISREGLDKASAKQIEAETGINVVYIYRCFKDKDEMFAHVFSVLDKELIDKLNESLEAGWLPEYSMKERCRKTFDSIWRFLLAEPDRCTCYLRYYYSRYFQDYSLDSHTQDYKPIVEKISDVFLDEANVWMLLNHLLRVMLDFSLKVFNKEIGDNEDTSEHVFRLIYNSTSPYFKPEA